MLSSFYSPPSMGFTSLLWEEFSTTVTACFWLSSIELSMGRMNWVLNLQTSLQGLETGRDVFARGKKKAFSMLVLCSMKRSGLLYPNQPQRGKVPKKAQIGLLLSGSTSPKGKRSMDIQSSSGVWSASTGHTGHSPGGDWWVSCRLCKEIQTEWTTGGLRSQDI